jgi:hypothetical protein
MRKSLVLAGAAGLVLLPAAAFASGSVTSPVSGQELAWDTAAVSTATTSWAPVAALCGGSGPRRCAAALEAVGRTAAPGTARGPSTPAAYGAALFACSTLTLSARLRLRSEPGWGRTAWRARGVPLKLFVEKVVTGLDPTNGFGCPVLSAVGGQIGPGVARLGVGQGLLVPVRVARSWEAEHRPLPGRGPLDDLEPV